jgi:hypothetical protein
MADDKSMLHYLAKINRLMSTLSLLIVFITVWSFIDLVKYSRNSQLFDIVVVLFGFGSIVCWLAIWNRIEKIKKNIGDNA